MCGIVGCHSTNAELNDGILDISRALNSITHRGPDDFGTFIDGQVALGHRRLSIIDLSKSGHQPMKSSNGRFTIVFNGEIYNYKQLRATLQDEGVSFIGNSDTEVLVNAYQQWGKDALKLLNGIFAFAIWDNVERSLLLARDRMGVKPLYFYYNSGLLRFGSEIKAILLQRGVDSRIAPQGFHEFLYYGNPLGETTLFADIKRLLPGCWIEVSPKGLIGGTYWRLEDVKPLADGVLSESDAISETRRLLEVSVSRQLASDVPVGVFLSGGIDSSAITAFASKAASGNLKSFSAGFDFDGGHNELPLAAKVAKLFGTDHHEIMIRGGDLQTVITNLIQHHDEPFSDAANIPLYLMTQAISSDCKVILQGDGGDELFGGYNRYALISRLSQYKRLFTWARPFASLLASGRRRRQIERFYSIFTEADPGTRLAKFLTVETQDASCPENMLSAEYLAIIRNTDPFRRYREVTSRFEFLNDEVQRLLWVDSCIILPDQFLEKVDKSTMANGVEVRVPFLDNDLTEFALGLPSRLKLKRGNLKHLLKQALANVLPHEVLYGPKKGFGVPYQNWLKGPLKSYMTEVFNDSSTRSRGILNYSVLNSRIKDHCEGRRDWGFPLWKMLNFCIWCELYNIKV